jgi:hypothetical protein
MKAKQRVPVLRGRQSENLAASTVRCDRILLRRASSERKIALESPGIWGNAAALGLNYSSKLTYADVGRAARKATLSGDSPSILRC